MTSVSNEKRVIYLRGVLDGRAWYGALAAMEMAIDAHGDQIRNDGVTPYVTHPIDVALYLSTLSSALMHPEEAIRDALLHDVVEDTSVTLGDIEAAFGEKSAATISLLSARKGETPEQKAERFKALAADPSGGPIKLADRDHNLSTMLGVFNRARVEKYVRETHEYFFPLAREARRRVPEQTAVYLNLKTALNRQIAPLEVLLSTPSALS